LLHRVRYLLAMRSAQSGSVVVGMSLLTVVLVSAMTALVSTGLPSLLERDANAEEQSVVIEAPVEASFEAPSESTIESTIETTTEPVSAAIETAAAVPELDTEVPQPALAERSPATPIQAASAETEAVAERSRPAAAPSDTRPVSTPAIEATIAETSVTAPIETQPEPAAPILPTAERPQLAVEPASPEAAPIEAVEPLQMASIAAPRPVAQLRGGRPLDRPVPSYPPSAARNRLEGQAEVRLTIGPDGRVVEASVIEETPAGHGFGEAALEAVRQWRFEPFTRDGRPVRHELQTGFDFTDPPDCGRVTGTRISRC
jgi:TonB family protein